MTKVAILGGGIAGLTAAYYLSDPALHGRYEVTVYQQGFRLGGKCATGRGESQRIEEHGLHMLMGYYNRTFSMLRAVYTEWAQGPYCPSDHPLRDFDKAFEPFSRFTVMEKLNGGQYEPWSLRLPPLPGKPGLRDEQPKPPLRPLDFIKPLLQYILDRRHDLAPMPSAQDPFKPMAEALSLWEKSSPSPGGHEPIIAKIDASLNAFSTTVPAVHLLRRTEISATSSTARRILWAVRLAGVVAKGLLSDIATGHFSDLDEREIRQWLIQHGASQELAEWVPVHLMYDLGFAYVGGDSSSIANGSAAAGVTLQVMLRCLLGYREAPLYRMKAGMADTVFTPLYRVLQSRGVRFKFFHRVTNVEVSAAEGKVVRIDLEKQLGVIPDQDSYVPVSKGNSDVIERWPAEPNWSALSYAGPEVEFNFEAASASPLGEQASLLLGQDFDHVVLAISRGAMESLAPDLKQFAGWTAMLEAVTTVKTQAAQLWFEQSPNVTNQRLVCTFASPFSTASDMSDLLPREEWPAGSAPQSLQYLVGVLPDGDGTIPDVERVRTNTEAWLAHEAPQIWSNLGQARLYHPNPGATDAERLAFQYFTSIENPSDRYVQSFPGSIKKRVSSKLPGLDNLALAGDWVRTGLSVGCVESAVQGGIQAAQVIQGRDVIVD